MSDAQELGKAAALYANENNKEAYARIQDKVNLILSDKSMDYLLEFERIFQESYCKYRSFI